MSSNKFNESYEMIEKIIKILDEVPAKSKDDVFKFLFEAAKEGGNEKETCKELILRLSQGKKSLQEYINEVKPNSNIERTLLFVFFLEKIKVNSITSNYISVCYELASLDEPGNLAQNLRDACSTRYGYLENEQSYYKVTERGRKFIESSIKYDDI